MAPTWRTTLKKYITEHYTQEADEWFDMLISTSGHLNITIVSRRFDQPLSQRDKDIHQILQHFEVPLSPGYLALYTPQEATSLELFRSPVTEETALYSWFDLANHAANMPKTAQNFQSEVHIPATIAFYSFKGGVGRTTALAQTAAILARRGHKVVAVDLDLEAPGLDSALAVEPLEHGIVDYFYERSYLPEEAEPAISVADIFSEVPIINAPGRLFLVPAGKLNLDYIAKVDDLRANAITIRGEGLWSTFYREITEQLEPDLILIDSRTGLNEWGAFSLLRVADKAIVFLYPNDQNRTGIDLIARALANILPIYFVFSPVPALGEVGLEMVKKQWNILQQDTHDEEGELEEEVQSEVADPIVIPYLTGIALAANYPVEELLSYYARIANIIEEDANTTRIESLLTDANSRKKIIASLEFPRVDAMQNENLEDLFQRTADFDRFLDSTTCLISGKKGTGKTELYTLLLKHADEARRLSRKRLDAVTCLSGHGSFRIHPGKDEFQKIAHAIEQTGRSWEGFWRAYLFLRMQQENLLQKFFRNNKDNKFQIIRTFLSKVTTDDKWTKEYTDLLIEITTDADLNLLLQDALSTINMQLEKSKEREIIWFLYDDLDVDFREENELRSKALTGLFHFIQACDIRRLKCINFKIFLREDIWRRLIFDNKSHFNGRDISLKWTRKDFLKLALRQAQQSKEFKNLVDSFSPVENIDQADEENIDKALELLWGSRRERNPKSKYVSRWVYERLTDSSETTFPRSLNILLKTARDHELTTFRGQQSPMDPRLLRPQSLVEGLMKASELRCDELRNEYVELKPFFDSLVGFNLLTSREDLESVWSKTAMMLSEFKDLTKFIDFLLDIGLIRRAKKEQEYRFAEIYTHGFKIYRGTRKY